MPGIAAQRRIALQVERQCDRGGDLRRAQAFERHRRAAAPHGVGQQGGQLRPARGVWINVDADIGAAGARALDALERLVHLAPIAPTGGLVMRALNRHIGRGADRQRFFDRRDHVIALVAHVRNIARRTGQACGGGAAGEFNRVGVARRFVDQAARDAEGTLFDRFAHEPLLMRLLVCFQAAIARAADARARGPQADERRYVERDALARNEVKEGIERPPLDFQPVHPRVALLAQQRFAA